MEAWRGLFCLTFLCFLPHVRGENGDFDLADALDDPKPTKKPSSGENGDFDLADALDDPKPTKKPSSGGGYPPGHGSNGQGVSSRSSFPGTFGGGGHPGHGNPQGQGVSSRSSFPGTFGGGGHPWHGNPQGGGYPPGHGSYGQRVRYRSSFPGTYGRGGHPAHGNPQGNRIVQIVSPTVSVAVVTLIAAAVGYCNRRRNHLGTNEPPTV